jgi:uncharacterized repeat protein (TIGR04076 family)
MHKCKITVLKRTINQDIIDEYVKAEVAERLVPCEHLDDGQEFMVEFPFAPPEGFCPWAWADIRKEVMAVMRGGTFDVNKDPNIAITCCTDGYRPVIFKVERVEE